MQPEKTMQGLRFGCQDCCLRQLIGPGLSHLALDRCPHPHGRFAGRGSQCDVQRSSIARLQQTDNIYNGGRLAGSRAASDNAQPAGQRNPGG